MPGEVKEVAPVSYSSGAINMRPDALDIAPVTPIDTSTYTPPSSMGFSPTGTSADPEIGKSVVTLDTPVVRAPPLDKTPPIDYTTPSGVLPFMQPVVNQRNTALNTLPDPTVGKTDDYPKFSFTPDESGVSRAVGSYPEYNNAGDPALGLGLPSSTTPSTIAEQTASAFPSYTQPSVSGIVPSKPIGSGRGDGAFEVAQRQADSSTITTPDQYTLASTESDRFTPSMDITSTTPKMRPTGLGTKPVETTTPAQTYKAGDSNQATAWMNLPDANIAQAADLNKRYATTGGTAVDGYAVGAITDGKSQGVYADKEGFALRNEENRVVYRNNDFDVPVVKSTVYERVFEGADKYKPAGKFNANEASTKSTNKKTAVTPAKKNQLSKTAKAKVGTDASGGDPNMAGAVWTSQPGTNVLTRTFPKKETKAAPAPAASNNSGGGSSDGGGGGSSSKIICTAMNEAYGFGSYRQAIWINYARKHLTKEHEVGYHTLFLPLVYIAYTKNYTSVRKILEHGTRHRTADLRAEMQNKKRDNLGRIYRTILEPVCYLVGKYKMFRGK